MSTYLEQRRLQKLGLKDPELKPKKEIPAESEKQKSLTKQYLKDRKAWIKKNPYCKAKLVSCSKMATDVHHQKGRGEFLLDQSTWLPVCRSCHDFITENSAEAIRLGLSESRLKVTVHDQIENTNVKISDAI